MFVLSIVVVVVVAVVVVVVAAAWYWDLEMPSNLSCQESNETVLKYLMENTAYYLYWPPFSLWKLHEGSEYSYCTY